MTKDQLNANWGRLISENEFEISKLKRELNNPRIRKVKSRLSQIAGLQIQILEAKKLIQRQEEFK